MLARIFRQWEVHLSKRDTNRKVLPFDWGLEFTQNGFAGAPPLQYLLEYARRAVEDSERYHSYAPQTDYGLEGDHLTFSSPIKTVYPENNTVHGRYFPTQSRGRVVLVLPQWNSNSQGHIALSRMLNHFGLSSLRITMPYHDLRMPGGLVRAEYMLSPNLGRTLQAGRQAVIDCRAAIDWLQMQGYERIGILGTSLGSCIGMITLAHDDRVQVSVQNHISPYFADVVWTGISTKHVRKGLQDMVTLDELRRIWMPLSPKAYIHRLVGKRKQSLLIHARYDHSFLPRLSREVLEDYRNLGLDHSVHELYCGHYTSGEFPFNVLLGYRMCDFLRKTL